MKNPTNLLIALSGLAAGVSALAVALVALLGGATGPEGPEGPRGTDAPIGTVVAFHGETLLGDDWLLCDGSPQPTSSYERLAKVIYGDTFEENTFSVPDLRGVFLRGQDWEIVDRPSPLGGDPEKNRRVGRPQADAVIAFETKALRKGAMDLIFDVHAGKGRAKSVGVVTGELWTEPRGGGGNEIRLSEETRPRNVVVKWIIKAR